MCNTDNSLFGEIFEGGTQLLGEKLFAVRQAWENLCQSATPYKLATQPTYLAGLEDISINYNHSIVTLFQSITTALMSS